MIAVRRQPQQPRAADRARLRRADAARPVGDRRAGRLRLGLGRRLAVLEAALRADLAAVGDLAAHLARPAGHGVHGLLDPQPALPRARVGDARRDLGRPDDLRHRHGQPRGGRASRVRGARARLRPPRHALRGGARRDPAALDRGQDGLPRHVPRLRRRLVLLGHRDGAADAGPVAAADLGRLEPAAEGRRPARRDRATARGRVPPDRRVRRRLDDLLPRAASRRSSSSSSARSSATPTSTTPTSRGW